ncbi:MAG TPA: TAXI family TRAP transporter solute-binding subunit [Gammaproteobacteria bacterium]|nr:TAXI family TRAP transporter solute-binding subunit [Gammaproteobacteria bacterium]
MRAFRAFGIAAGAAVLGVAFLAAMLEFLAPDLAYRVHDRTAELFSGRGSRPFRIALGSQTGTSYRVGTVLNRYLKSKAGYELELGNTDNASSSELLDPAGRVDFAIINSAEDELLGADPVVGIAALEPQYFFVIVPDSSGVREFRDLAGAVNPGVRGEGRPPTLGERLLDFYKLASPSADGAPARTSIVRPRGNNLEDFEAGLMTAATRTQFLNSDLIENIVHNGGYRLVPIRDNEAVARLIPGTRAASIPAGLYGPERRIPPDPVPTFTVQQLLVARADVPGRVVRDVLEALYDPRFAREVQYELDEAAGRDVSPLRLHPAAEIYYHRNDPLTSDLLGRLSFVGSAIAALFAGYQFVTLARRNERVRARRKLLGEELAKLEAIRREIESAPDAAAAKRAASEADDVLSVAERDAAGDLLDAAGIESLRSVHRLCWRAADGRGAPAVPSPVAAAAFDAPTEPRASAPPASAAIGS